ncbi:hypothetical protein M8818_003189 [Zalaria obscura]|uniref:Uncharacterized protein n=1 Tax=Zalaria obscura TaxID=2024903 RepID=A0ACC3SFB0_9PEZI
MDTAKRDPEIDGLEVADDIPLADDDTEMIGTSTDRRDMFRMNKVQEMRVHITDEVYLDNLLTNDLAVASIGLSNGGTAGLIYMCIVVWIGFLCIYTSMAEQGSMAPTAGGQYHWVSEFAPRKYQKQLSYVVGWLCVIGWQVSVASVGFLAGTQIQGLLVLNYPWYVFERWHGTLLVIAIVVFAGLFNTLLARQLPIIEGLTMIIHIGGFFGILIPLWVLSPQSDAHTIFTQFNNPGWSSTGTSCMVGILAAIALMLGSDSVAHMSEEIQNAPYILPRTMFWSTFFNGALGLIMVIGLGSASAM